MEDKELVAAIRRRDEVAARQLYDRYIDRVHSVCYRILLDRSVVMDCVQEVWLKVFRSVETLEVKGSLHPWLTRIAANTAIDLYRKRKSGNGIVYVEDDFIESMPDEPQSFTRRLEEQEVKQKVMGVLKQLSLQQRTAFVLRYFEDVSTKDIAELLGCAEGTVRSHIRRSILAVRKRLGKELMEYMES